MNWRKYKLLKTQLLLLLLGIVFSVKILSAQVSSVTIPNVFTPNGDGFNDEFVINANGILVNNFDLKIYNRWGVLLFSTSNIHIGWDGRTSAGIKVTEGVYFFTLDFNGVMHKGSVLVVY